MPSLLDLGTIIGGKYCLEQPIGEGGFATIWKAVQMDLDRPVAIKFLQPAAAKQTEDQAERMLREARVAAAVRHRNVVDILDVGKTDEGQPYIVMELLEGETLGDRLERKRVRVQEMVTLCAATLRGLAACHDAGVVHRDLKPENIFLVKDADGWFPKLVDFGISRTLGDNNISSVMPTMDGIIMGTPHYMSPEQARALPSIDHRTDIYTMGVIIYEAITGELPFHEESTLDLLMLIAKGTAPTIAMVRSEVGQSLSDVVERAMARNPEARYQSAREMRKALIEAATKTAEVSTNWSQLDAPKRVPTGSINHTPTAGGGGLPSLLPHGSANRLQAVRRAPVGPDEVTEDQLATPSAAEVPRRDRRVIYMALGAGLVVLSLVAAIALGGSGSGAEDAPPQTAATESEPLGLSGEGVAVVEAEEPQESATDEEPVEPIAPPVEEVQVAPTMATGATMQGRMWRPGMMMRGAMMAETPMRVFGDPDF